MHRLWRRHFCVCRYQLRWYRMDLWDSWVDKRHNEFTDDSLAFEARRNYVLGGNQTSRLCNLELIERTFGELCWSAYNSRFNLTLLTLEVDLTNTKAKERQEND